MDKQKMHNDGTGATNIGKEGVCLNNFGYLPKLAYQLKCLCCLFVFGLFGTIHAIAQEDIADTVVIKDTVKPKIVTKENAGRHMTLGVDLYHPIINNLYKNQDGYEFSLDYYMKHALYLASEFGWGSSNIDYPDLKYRTDNNFFKFGVNRGVLLRQDSTDWDNLFIGFRFAGANVHRGAASYVITDSLWGSTSGNVLGRDFNAYWVELIFGLRVQLVKGLSAGWDLRGKFLLNGSSFQDLAPLNIAGYGKGDSYSVFDFNVFLTYGISWKRKFQRQQVKPDEKVLGKPLEKPIEQPVVPKTEK